MSFGHIAPLNLSLVRDYPLPGLPPAGEGAKPITRETSRFLPLWGRCRACEAEGVTESGSKLALQRPVFFSPSGGDAEGARQRGLLSQIVTSFPAFPVEVVDPLPYLPPAGEGAKPSTGKRVDFSPYGHSRQLKSYFRKKRSAIL